VENIEDFKVGLADFIIEKTGRFRDFYNLGPQLGSGKLSSSTQQAALARCGGARTSKLACRWQ